MYEEEVSEMAAPTTRTNEIRAGGSSASQPEAQASLTRKEWMDVASFIFAGIAAIGLLVVVFGVFLTPNDMAILVGASIVSLAAFGWLAAAIMLIAVIFKQWLISPGKPSAPGPSTRPE